MAEPNDNDLQALLDAPLTKTRRPTVPAMEERLFRMHSVLDHGFIRVIDYMGNDSAIVQAARVSYGSGTKSVTNDRGLIRYLMRHRHTTPFEMCEIKLHVKLPIFIARQWIRHRTANVNEYSARYSILDKEFYVPEPSHLAEQSMSNKQGRKNEPVSPEKAAAVLELLRRDAMSSYDTYQTLLNDQGDGAPVDEDAPQLARELARINLNLSYYTQWYWKVDLHNLMHFLSLRMHPHAQYEIRVYANIIGEITRDWVPAAYEAFDDYRLKGGFFSGQELEILQAAFKGGDINELIANADISRREESEFRRKIKVRRPKNS